MNYTAFDYLWFFIIYSFLGWCVEVAYHVVTQGKFVNRGFLNGPVCPIYGFGLVGLILFLRPITDNLLLLFLGSVVFTSLLEFIGGYILEKVFNKKWWDYSDRPFNIKGYICLSFSIAWGLGAVFVLEILHPTIERFVSMINNLVGVIFLILISVYYIADLVITVLGIMKIKTQNRLMGEIAEQLRAYSEDIGEDIYKGMSIALKTKDNLKQKIATSADERKLQIENLKQKYEELRKEKSFVHRRIEKAFPNIQEKLSRPELHLRLKVHINNKNEDGKKD